MSAKVFQSYEKTPTNNMKAPIGFITDAIVTFPLMYFKWKKQQPEFIQGCLSAMPFESQLQVFVKSEYFDTIMKKKTSINETI